MKDIQQLPFDLEKMGSKLIPKLKETQRKTAETICSDVIALAPMSSGDYISSIQVGETEYKDKTITTEIYTDLLTEDGYAVGRIIEHGSGIYAEEEHIGHTETFKKSGYRYWYIPPEKSKSGEWETRYAQTAKPHWKPALDKNHQTYKQNIADAVKEAFK